MMEFSDFLQQRLGNHVPEEIEELVLDGLFHEKESLNPSQKKGLEKYKNLKHLSLNGIGFKSFLNFPSIPTLEILQVKDNEISGEDLSIILSLYPLLYKIKLNNNKIEKISLLKGLYGSKIEKIEVKDNPFILSNSNYKEEIFKMFPNIYSIDGIDKNGEFVNTTIYDDYEEFNCGEELSELDDDEDSESEKDIDAEGAEEEGESEVDESERSIKKQKKN